MIEFAPFPKIARLNRTCVVTEKIDGTNANIVIETVAPEVFAADHPNNLIEAGWMYLPKAGVRMLAGSRNRWLTWNDDNYGFAQWVGRNADELARLGPGHHFGEWWGVGINRGYGLSEKRFSLFNTSRWRDPVARPACCHVVPVLYEGLFGTLAVNTAMGFLHDVGSYASPGFTDPEGVVVYHTAANLLLKVTLKGDEEGKSGEAHPKKERAPRPPRDPSKGGRRIAQLPFDFADRRKPQS